MNTVDYVIVGGGSAGCVLAARLSEDPGRTVLLLEAGGNDRSPLVRVPVAFPRAFTSRFNWGFHTVPQRHLDGRERFYPRGRGLGGSSLINAMIYVRGHPGDYDRWREAGCPGWGWADVEGVFRKAEPPIGPMAVERPRDVNPLSEAFVAAANECGLPIRDDLGSDAAEGIGFYRVTQRRGQRHSVAAAYLHPAMRRPNLFVRQAHVRRVHFADQRAIGVEAEANGSRITLSARRGVVVAAGAIQSPQLLVNSGIGPRDDLQRLSVPCVVERPTVGANLHDHACVAVGYHATQPVSLIRAKGLGSLWRYLLLRRGPMTSNVAEAGGFVRARPAEPVPDLQFHFLPVHVIDHGRVEPRRHGYGIAPTVLRPLSRGRVSVNPADPFGPPLIDPNYLAEPADLTAFVAGLRLARQLGEAAAFARYRGPEAYPGCGVVDDEAMAAYVRTTLQTLYHPAGTCRMGTDENAVVDPSLAVRGVERLWVADASVMPTPIGANTNATVVMIGEKASTQIRMND